MSSCASTLLKAQRDFATACDLLHFGAPVAYVYNPLVYASELVTSFAERYAHGKKRFVLLGMNPGPFGMAQTGIPFGEVALVKNWLKLDAAVQRPAHEHPKRPVEGLRCTRSEVSGRRLWGAIAAKFPQAEAFFSGAYALNYCPLLFLDAGARNLTPDKLPRSERSPLEQLCDSFLREAVGLLQTGLVIGVGAYASQAALRAVGDCARVVTISHPSPASPKANRGWTELVRAELLAADIEPFL